MEIKAVLFDMDGLMVDTESLSTEAFINSAKAQGYNMTKEETLKVLGFTKANIYQFWIDYFQGTNVDGKKLVDDHYEYIENVLYTVGPEKMPYVEELLKYLRENNYKIAVASSSDTADIKNNLEKTKLEKYIDEIASGAEVENGKPAPDVFLLAAERLDVDPKDCLILEDSKAGIKAGKASGAMVFMVPDMFTVDKECEDTADRILTNLGEVIEILEGKMSKILLDSADINKAKEIAKYYSIAGITTNPSILSKIDKPLEEKLAEIKEFAYDKYEIHVQTTEDSAQKILKEAKTLKAYFGETFFIKIPVTKEGLEAIKLCDKEGINVTATAVLSAMQALAAAKNGASYVAPYVNRLENIGQDAEEVIVEIKELLKDYKTEVLAASFKNVKQFKNILLCGAEAATVAPDVLETSIWHPYTDKSVTDFEKDWERKFNSSKVVDALK